jgi:hypothetical protein
MVTMKKQRTRALATPGTPIGRVRHNLYKRAYSRINDARAKGFYLEAITLIESLIGDRLEHRLTFLKQRDFSFKNLGELITEARKTEIDGELKQLVLGPLDSWRQERNSALHEMAKIADGDLPTWEKRMSGLETIAMGGLTTLRAIDKRCQQLRKPRVKRVSGHIFADVRCTGGHCL